MYEVHRRFTSLLRRNAQTHDVYIGENGRDRKAVLGCERSIRIRVAVLESRHLACAWTTVAQTVVGDCTVILGWR